MEDKPSFLRWQRAGFVIFEEEIKKNVKNYIFSHVDVAVLTNY
jgi:hypothetical protein